MKEEITRCIKQSPAIKEVDMQRILNHSNIKEEHMHCRLNIHGIKEDDMQRIYNLHESGRSYPHCRLHTIIPIAIDMQCVDHAPTTIEPYMQYM